MRQITLTINDKVVVADFGSNYFYKHFKTLSGIDIISENLSGLLSSEGFDIAAKMVVAGNMALKSLESKYPQPPAPPDIEVSEAEHWFLSQDLKGAYAVINDIVAVVFPKKEAEPGEAAPQAGQP